MKTLSRWRPWLQRLTLPAVVLLLALTGAIEYAWFSQSAAVEVNNALRSLENGVRQATFRELQRFGPVAVDLEALKTASNPTRETLDRLWSAYGPSGSSPRLISLVGFVDGAGALQVRRFDAEAWTQVEAGVLGIPPKDHLYLLAFGANRSAPSALVAVDLEDFLQTYLVPSLLDQYPGVKVAWESGPDLRPPNNPGDEPEFTFNPLGALAGASTVPSTLRVSVPRFLDSPFRALGPRPSLWGNRGDFPTPTLTLVLTLDPSSPIYAIEDRLAVNWLGATVLLVILGLAFVLVQRQTARLEALRVREREFVASVSHELRTPLTVIRSAAENFRQGIVTPERQGRYGDLIYDQSLRLGRMIEQMISFAQAEGSAAPRVEAPLRFTTWLDEVRPPLETLAASRQVALIWDVAGVPPEGKTDPDGVRLILENLVVNALNHAYGPAEAAGEGRVVRITVRHLVPDRLELVVDDDGRGISPKEAHKVFEPFYRDQVSRERQETGSGLGLALALRQARRLGGSLRLESPWRRTDGVKRPGCRFIATLPFTVAPGTEASDGR